MIPSEGYVQPSVIPRCSYPLTPEIKYMKKVLTSLLSHAKAGPFTRPVNAIAEGIYPDYFKVVQHPMDLSTVYRRVENGWYSSADICQADIMLVFNNAMLYNPPDHTIHQWAKQLATITNNRLKIIPRMSAERRMLACHNILDSIMKDGRTADYVVPFLVISTKYANDSYIPTDLDHIKKRLLAGFYRNPTQFANDFRKMISETYRFCSEKDPLIDQARELQHQFEVMFAKHVQTYEEDEDNLEEDIHMSEDSHLDETDRLSYVLSIGKAMEAELDDLVKRETEKFEAKLFNFAEKRFSDAKSWVNDIENLPQDLITDIIEVMKDNGEDINIEEDGTLAVEYSQLCPKTIREVRKMIDEKTRETSVEDENIDIMS